MRDTQDDNHSLVIFPWVGLREGRSLRWGRFEIRRWEDVRDQIRDDPLRLQADLIVACHTERASRSKGRTVSGLGVLTRNFPSLARLSTGQRQRVEEFRAVLSLGALAESLVHAALSGGGHRIAVSEHLEYFEYTLVPGSTSISTTAGLIVAIRSFGNSTDDWVVPRPAEIGPGTEVQCMPEILQGLRLARRHENAAFRRILAAAELMRASQYNTHAVHVSARILLQIASLETLLDLRGRKGSKSRLLRDAIESRCAKPADPRRPLPKGTVGEPEPPRTAFGHWAYHAYRLRNELAHSAHGPNRKFTYFGQHHALIAPLVFVQCLQHELSSIAARAGTSLSFLHRLKHNPTAGRRDSDGSRRTGFQMAFDFTVLGDRLFPDGIPDGP